MIDVKNVSAGYGDGEVIHNVNFRIGRGEIYILLGPNGSGKTTIFRVVAGILPPTKGRVMIDGVDIWEDERVKSRLGYLPEGERVYPDLTVLKNMEFFAKIYGIGEDRIREILENFGLSEYRNKMAGTLSRGLRKRLAIARTLLHDPEVVILDEPFSNLDIESVMALRDRIFEMLEEKKSILLSTHILDEIHNFEEGRVAIVKGGRMLVEKDLQSLVGSTEMLLKVSNPDKAGEILKDHGFSVSVTKSALIVGTEKNENISDAIKVLIENGIAVLEARYKSNPLEKFFK
ncbi:heme ABC exporter ATP-binding protein CcmA [Archaeoglobus neptunius]|uniref:heme ABC exporter ATP-binding protein CcmA n=1 Tax=Archaeoglobus neptunius TaxID=2798580 RepID=UPI0019251FFF|nr:heme ABC exporter ATP-binding protein CcmA [Archaeoglobus neptunius]